MAESLDHPHPQLAHGDAAALAALRARTPAVIEPGHSFESVTDSNVCPGAMTAGVRARSAVASLVAPMRWCGCSRLSATS